MGINMREITFKGKRTDNGEWEYGYYIFDPQEEKHYIYHINNHPCGVALVPHEVIPETISQYTGLKDKNDTKIFEGDIVKAPYIDPIFHTNWDTEEPTEIALVKFDRGQYYIEYVEGRYTFTVNACKEFIEIIGNIHDNPELLKGDEQYARDTF